jgi:hypothetical protein
MLKELLATLQLLRSSDKQVFSNKYINDQIIQVRTAEKLTAREKVTNI